MRPTPGISREWVFGVFWLLPGSASSGSASSFVPVAVAVVEPEVVVAETQCVSYSGDVRSTDD